MEILSIEEAVSVVKDGDTISVGGVVQNMVPEALCAGLGDRYLRTGSPRNLNHLHLHIFGLGPDAGMEHFSHAGMTKRMIVTAFSPPYWVKESRMVNALKNNEMEVHVVPAGVVAANFRETAAKRPGVLSKIGLDTFIDPRNGGGTMNPAARDSDFRTSKYVEFEGEEYLFYPSQAVDVSFIRGTVADEDGNVTFEEEGVYQSVVAQAMATKASGGTVIVQVQRIAPAGTLDARLVRLPAMFVDLVTVVPDAPLFDYNTGEGSLAFTGATRMVTPEFTTRPFSAATIAARRAALEARPGYVVNLGAGAPALELPAILDQREVTISVEHGSLGGTNLGGLPAATHWNPAALMDSNMTFDFYNGGGLDMACLGIAQVDGSGSVNVAKAGDMLVGVGGFVDIAQSSPKVVFCGTFRSGGLDATVESGKLVIRSEGKRPKFVDSLELVCFAGDRAYRTGQDVTYVTERAVFRLTARGLTLTEVAPGMRVDDILAGADCKIVVADDVRAMPSSVFDDAPLSSAAV